MYYPRLALLKYLHVVTVPKDESASSILVAHSITTLTQKPKTSQLFANLHLKNHVKGIIAAFHFFKAPASLTPREGPQSASARTPSASFEELPWMRIGPSGADRLPEANRWRAGRKARVPRT